MAKTIFMAGKSGPAFGDRASWIALDVLQPYGSPTGEDSVIGVSVTNWPANDRADSMRAAFDYITRVWED